MDALDYIEPLFSFVAYVNQYESEGISFTFSNSKEVSAKDAWGRGEFYNTSGQKLTPPEDGVYVKYSRNTEPELEIVKRFYARRWESERDFYFGEEESFINREIEFLEKLPKKVQEKERARYVPLLNYFKSQLRELNEKSLSPNTEDQSQKINTQNAGRANINSTHIAMAHIIMKEMGEFTMPNGGINDYWKGVTKSYVSPNSFSNIQKYYNRSNPRASNYKRYTEFEKEWTLGNHHKSQMQNLEMVIAYLESEFPNCKKSIEEAIRLFNNAKEEYGR